MSKYRFSNTERYALWKAYDGRCFYCENPLDLQNMTVDHILPERLNENIEELEQVCKKYEINENFPNFQINDFPNWVPACFRKCNARKGGKILSTKTILLLLNEVQQRLPKVYHELEKARQKHGISHLLGSLSTAIENKHLTIQEIHKFVAQIESSQHAEEPLILTFGLMIEDVENSKMLPCDVPRNYPYLCDWLELDLVKHLRTIITTPFHYAQPSERSGETLSVRIVFPRLNYAELEKFSLSWWEILEAANFWDIYKEKYNDAFQDSPKQEYFGQLETD